MKKQAVLRKTLTGEWEQFAFANTSRFFFVKNYSDEDIYVSFENWDDSSHCVKIASGMGEEVAISFDHNDRPEYYVKELYVKGTGEVEVQATETYLDFVRHLALKVEVVADDVVLYGKAVGDLQENVVVDDGAIEGTLNYITDYTGFSDNPQEQVGNFIALRVTSNYPATIVYNGTVVNNGTEDVTLGDDGIIVIRVEGTSQTIQFTATDGVDTTSIALSCADLVLIQPEPTEWEIDGVTYHHRILVSELPQPERTDTTSYYYPQLNVDEEPVGSEPSELPFLKNPYQGGTSRSWTVQSSSYGPSTSEVTISDVPSESRVIEVSETKKSNSLNAQYFANGYLDRNDGEFPIFYYNLVGE